MQMRVESWEAWQVFNEEISVEFLREVMRDSEALPPKADRKVNLWSHVKTDCQYFTGNTTLKCAINPSESCFQCNDFVSILPDSKTK